MRSMQTIFLSLLVFVMTATALASKLDDGGISGGGGGGTAPGTPITQEQVREILKKARLEIYMALALQDQGTSFPWPELFEGKENIYRLLTKYQIFGNKEDCHDSFGNNKDGSIHSPVDNSICISLKNLSEKLTTDNARAQILALVAHEYSHLKGFDEEKAQALQRWLIPVFANSSSEQSLNLLDFMTRQGMDLADYLHYYDAKPKESLSWDYLCFLSEKIATALIIVEQQFTDKPFSISTREIYTKQNSYLVKQRAITTQVCAMSQFHPQKSFFQRDVEEWFRNSDVIFDKDLEDVFLRTADYDVSRNIIILGNLPIQKISDFNDFDREFRDMKSYIYDVLRIHLNELWYLDADVLTLPTP